MGKPEQFLWVVQTLMIRNAINLMNIPDRADQYRHEISATGAFGMCDDALYASERIPEGMSASEAANQFFTYLASNQRETEEKASGKKMDVPSWFAR